ncbi:UNVERIFIED_CONTAM: hypothetical protein K2H54_051671 [Gekko kuhli]
MQIGTLRAVTVKTQYSPLTAEGAANLQQPQLWEGWDSLKPVVMEPVSHRAPGLKPSHSVRHRCLSSGAPHQPYETTGLPFGLVRFIEMIHCSDILNSQKHAIIRSSGALLIFLSEEGLKSCALCSPPEELAVRPDTVRDRALD